MEKQQVKLLVLLGCNCGHFDYKESIARAFANKVTGKIVASDGTVATNVYKIGFYMFDYISFRSEKDEHFDGINEKLKINRSNYGWMVYVGTHTFDYDSRVYTMASNIRYNLTVDTICRFIDSYSFYYGFK